MIIDVFSHILPPKYWAAACNKYNTIAEGWIVSSPSLIDLDARFRAMERHPEVLQVLTTTTPPALEALITPADSVEFARMANDEMAELIVKYPDKFAGAVACLPLDNMDAALEETDRAITKLGLKGVQLNASLFGDHLGHPKYRPLYEKMVHYNSPIWIHPFNSPQLDSEKSLNPIEVLPYGLFAWPLATGINMMNLVTEGIFNDYPDIKFITHHCGGVVPLLEGRITWLYNGAFPVGHPARTWKEHFRKFYNDTACCGTTSALMCGYDFFGADHILFGTDVPFPPFGLTLETIDSVRRMGISDAEKEKIFSRNAIKLLNIPT
ncbi:amidohydrolase family protein [Chloroflexota bacterium]